MEFAVEVMLFLFFAVVFGCDDAVGGFWLHADRRFHDAEAANLAVMEQLAVNPKLFAFRSVDLFEYERADGRILKVADLVDDGPERHSKVLSALKDPAQKNNRDHVDVIIALGMAKEGFDWIWCEHALTIGYRSSLTEIIQIIGRATRDAKGKTRSRFAAFVQDKTTLERGLFDGEHANGETLAEELTQVRMGKIVKDKYPKLGEEDHEAVRQHAIAALNITQQAKKALNDDPQKGGNTALIDGVRKFAMDVRDLDIDLIDRINPFGEAYAIQAGS